MMWESSPPATVPRTLWDCKSPCLLIPKPAGAGCNNQLPLTELLWPFILCTDAAQEKFAVLLRFVVLGRDADDAHACSFLPC